MIRKVFFKTMMGAFIIGAVIASCVEVKDLYDPEYAAKLAEYRAKWVEQFGEIDPNEDWGFGSDEETAGDSLTRGSFANGNMWYDYSEVPNPLTDEQINIVTNWFKSNVNPEGIYLNWSDFFVQHVSSNEAHTNRMGNFVVGDNNESVNNFNGGTCTQYSDVWYGELRDENDFNTKITSEDRIMFVQNVPTSRFGIYSTVSGEYCYNYVIIPGKRIAESLDGMYFLGFDFENNGDTEDKVFPKDGYYDDWIIKLTPAKYHNAKRIICEDLGTIGDFDFNDIVFDVSPLGEYWNPELQKVVYSEAVITVRAAGGTLPVFVGGVNVKESLGVPEHVMVNTDAVGGMDDVPPAIFRIPWPATDNLRDIEVLVKTNEAVCALTAPIGDAPQKLCVPADFVWPSERVNIKTVYENFPNVGWENSISEGDGTGDDEVSEPTEPEDPSDTPEDPKEDATDYGVLIAAEDLVDGQPIPAKYFENVGESCTITVVGNNVNINLRRFDWNPNINIKTEQGEVVSISLTGDLLTLAKNGELYCTFNYVESTIAIYVKQD